MSERVLIGTQFSHLYTQWIHQPRLRDVREEGGVFTGSLLIFCTFTMGGLSAARVRFVCVCYVLTLVVEEEEEKEEEEKEEENESYKCVNDMMMMPFICSCRCKAFSRPSQLLS